MNGVKRPFTRFEWFYGDEECFIALFPTNMMNRKSKECTYSGTKKMSRKCELESRSGEIMTYSLGA